MTTRDAGPEDEGGRERGRDDQDRRSAHTGGSATGPGGPERGRDSDRDRHGDRGDHGDRDASSRDRTCGGRHRSRHGRRRHHRAHGEGRKERVLHTRISEQLAGDIRRLADDLRVPASNLVRNVLEEVFTMMDSVSEDVGELFEDVLDEAQETRERVRRRSARRQHRESPRRARARDRARRFDEWVDGAIGEDDAPSDRSATEAQEPEARPTPDPAPPLDEIVGWQPLVLNHARHCVHCGVSLSRGAEAYLGMTRTGLSDAAVCRRCVGSLD